jgi:linearmycin/streptolysin S transport system permease protein
VLTVFCNELRMLWRDRSAVVWLLLAPVGFITLIAAVRFDGGAAGGLPLPVVDEDQGPVARAFIKLLGVRSDVVEMSREAAEHMVRDENRAPAAIVFPEGLSKRYLTGRTSEILLLTDPAEAIGVRRAQILLLLVSRDAADLADPVGPDRLEIVERNLTGDRLSRQSHEQNVPGFTIMFTLLAVVFGTSSSLQQEREWGTTQRLLIAPVSFGGVLLAKLAARGVIGVAQMLTLLLWGHLIFGISLGSSVVALVAVSVACVFASAGLAILVAGVARTAAQALPIALGVVIVLSAISGLWWPLSVQPSWMQRLAPLAFPTWAMQAMTDLVLRDRGLAAIGRSVGVLVVEGSVILVVGMWLFRSQIGRR